MSLIYDLAVIGAGSGGVRAARISAGHGAKVALIETSLQHGPPHYSAVGGTCVNVGCVPKKLMVMASRFSRDVPEALGFGWKSAELGEFDWKKFMSLKDAEISRLNGIYNRMLNNAGVTLIEGLGRFGKSKNEVEVVNNDGEVTQTITAKNVLICVGGWPMKPSIPGIEHAITSNEIFYVKEHPKTAVIVGGGYIAVEFAGILAGMGTKVTLVYRGELFLRGFDGDMRAHLCEEMKKNPNITLLFDSDVNEITKCDSGLSANVSTRGAEGTTTQSIECDQVLYATGRVSRTDRINLGVTGVNVLPNGDIPVNEYSQTNVEGVYAVGDVTGRIALTPVALMEGHRLADTLFNKQDRKCDHEYVASTVFSTPEIASCGFTEENAAKKFQNLRVYRSKFWPMQHQFPQADIRAMYKLIVDDASDRVVGVHLACDAAGETMQGIAVAMKMGATKTDFDNTIGIHPTAAEEFVTMRQPTYFYKDGVKVDKL